MSTRRHVLLFFAALLGATACEDRPSPPPVIWEGDFIRYHADDQGRSDICGGTFNYLEAEVSHLQSVFSRPFATIDFVFLPGGTAPFCREHLLGCADGSTAYSTEAVHVHELVHAVRANHLAYRALEEGAAEAFGDDWTLAPVQGDLESILESRGRDSTLEWEEYPRVGHFVSYLAAEYGVNTTAQALDATSIEDKYTAMSKGVEAVFDDPLATILARYNAEYPICDSRRFRDDTVECNGNPLEAPTTAGEQLSSFVDLTCDDAEAIGPRLGEFWRNVPLHVAQKGLYNLNIRSDGGGGRFRLTECGRSCFAEDELWLDIKALDGPVCLDSTTYLLRMSAEASSSDAFAVNIAFIGEAGCE